jgi:hypothetical protein
LRKTDKNDAAAPGHVCPGIRIHAIDIAQPPGIGFPPIADIEALQAIVTAALAPKSTAETPKNTWREARSEAMIVSPVPQLHRDNHAVAQRLPYLSWWRHRPGGNPQSGAADQGGRRQTR